MYILLLPHFKNVPWLSYASPKISQAARKDTRCQFITLNKKNNGFACRSVVIGVGGVLFGRTERRRPEGYEGVRCSIFRLVIWLYGKQAEDYMYGREVLHD